MSVLALHDVTMRYPGGTEALRHVSFEVQRGEFLFLSGPSGAGKTTLIRLILRMERATEGDILVFGRNLRALRRSAVPFLRRNIGVVFQDFRLLPARSVFDNVAIGLHILGLTGREVRRRVEGALTDLSIERHAHAYPTMLSGGEQQRVAIARALVMQPALILADEPTGNLDWELSTETVKLFEELNARGASVLMATHDRFLLDAFPKRTLLLNKGSLVEDRAATAPRKPADFEVDERYHYPTRTWQGSQRPSLGSYGQPPGLRVERLPGDAAHPEPADPGTAAAALAEGETAGSAPSAEETR